MKYIRVSWKHTFDNEPVELLSEMDEARFETQKIEIFRDGSIGFASGTESVAGTRLSDEPLPSITEIAADPQFEPEEISQQDFDQLWSKRYQKL